ncbi:hypothetical protein ACK2MY_004900 [Pseudomonas aeruginosa]
MTESKICTCPSGDGSLRHPCPAHPAVEQVGANVGHGHVFPRADGVKMRCGGPGLCSECTADASRARAALAQPSGEVVVTKNESGAIVSVTRQDKEGRVLSVIAESATLTAQAEQAEAERPAVVGYRSMESGMVYDQDYGLKDPEALTTVAECERIVGVLRAEIAEWQEAAGRSRSDVVAYIAERAKLLEERDAALARVAELERQVPVATVAKVPGEDWNSLDFHRDLQDMQPGTKLYAAPVAQAQHSVPEGFIGRLSEFLAQRGATGKALLRELRALCAAAPGKEVGHE